MKSTTLPALRVSAELRREVEALLQEGETLSSFVLEAVSQSVEARRARQQFIERGLASAERARQTGRYVPASSVLRKLSSRLARKRAKGA